MLTRQLFSGKIQCPADCAYCFAKWAKYTPPATMDYWENWKKASIVYPCCDSDISSNKEVITSLWKMAENQENLYISMSVKRTIDDSTLGLCKKLDQYLRSNKKGFIKISISLTTKYRISEFEPGTASYEERRNLFVHIRNCGFHTAIVFKPILPFISINEYKEMIDDFPDCKYFLLGSLYVDEETDFYQNHIKGKYETKTASIAWLYDQPLWKYVAQEDRLSKIETYIISRSPKVFHSDVDLIDYISKHDMG